MNTALQTVIPCVHYDDFLALTLPHNLPFLGSVTVLTSPRDTATIRLAKRLGVSLMITDAWHTGGPLNKAAALNQWVTHASAFEAEAWLMVLDADILLFEAVPGLLQHLNRACLYGPRRRMCDHFVQLKEFMQGSRSLSDFPVEPLVRVNLKPVDSELETAANAAALSGYFQLWHPAGGEPKHFPETGTAQSYDVLFGLMFPEECRILLPQEVLHIGPTQVNWSGRQSPRWNFGTLR